MKHLIAVAALFLAACGGGDPDPGSSIHETIASTQYLGASGNTHVNEVEAVLITADSRVTVVVDGEFVADNTGGPAGALVYSKFSPIWNVDGHGWTTGAGSPALVEIQVASTARAVYRRQLRATYTLEVPAGSAFAAGIFFVDQMTAQVPGRLVNARTRVEIEASR